MAMADVAFLHLHDPDDLSDLSLSIDSLPFCSHASVSDLLSLRDNQVNFVMDLFHQRVEQSQLMDHSDFGIIDGNAESAEDGMNLDLVLGLGFGLDTDGREDGGFVVEFCGDDHDVDVLFLETRDYGSESGNRPSTGIVRVDGLESCSDDDEVENEVHGIELHSDDEYGLDNDDDIVIPLCWDSFQLAETNEDYEWEEVDVRVDDREVLSMFLEDDDGSVSLVLEAEEVGVLGNVEWEVLLNVDNLERIPDLEHYAEPYMGENDDYFYTPDNELLFGQFTEIENSMVGRPAASQTVVQNLPLLVLTREDVCDNNALCAVCKDEMVVGDKAKQLPCAHRYHGDCIVPWLRIRNTCPVCRYELPTDDADYERRRTLRARRGM